MRTASLPSWAHPGDWWAHRKSASVKESASFGPEGKNIRRTGGKKLEYVDRSIANIHARYVIT